MRVIFRFDFDAEGDGEDDRTCHAVLVRGTHRTIE